MGGRAFCNSDKLGYGGGSLGWWLEAQRPEFESCSPR